MLGLLNEPWFICMAKDGTKPTLPNVMVSEAHLCRLLQILAIPRDFGKSHCLLNMLTAVLSTHKRAKEEEYFQKNFQDEIEWMSVSHYLFQLILDEIPAPSSTKAPAG